MIDCSNMAFLGRGRSKGGSNNNTTTTTKTTTTDQKESTTTTTKRRRRRRSRTRPRTKEAKLKEYLKSVVDDKEERYRRNSKKLFKLDDASNVERQVEESKQYNLWTMSAADAFCVSQTPPVSLPLPPSLPGTPFDSPTRNKSKPDDSWLFPIGDASANSQILPVSLPLPPSLPATPRPTPTRKEKRQQRQIEREFAKSILTEVDFLTALVKKEQAEAKQREAYLQQEIDQLMKGENEEAEKSSSTFSISPSSPSDTAEITRLQERLAEATRELEKSQQSQTALQERFERELKRHSEGTTALTPEQQLVDDSIGGEKRTQQAIFESKQQLKESHQVLEDTKKHLEEEMGLMEELKLQIQQEKEAVAASKKTIHTLLSFLSQAREDLDTMRNSQEALKESLQREQEKNKERIASLGIVEDDEKDLAISQVALKESLQSEQGQDKERTVSLGILEDDENDSIIISDDGASQEDSTRQVNQDNADAEQRIADLRIELKLANEALEKERKHHYARIQDEKTFSDRESTLKDKLEKSTSQITYLEELQKSIAKDFEIERAKKESKLSKEREMTVSLQEQLDQCRVSQGELVKQREQDQFEADQRIAELKNELDQANRAMETERQKSTELTAALKHQKQSSRKEFKQVNQALKTERQKSTELTAALEFQKQNSGKELEQANRAIQTERQKSTDLTAALEFEKQKAIKELEQANRALETERQKFTELNTAMKYQEQNSIKELEQANQALETERQKSTELTASMEFQRQNSIKELEQANQALETERQKSTELTAAVKFQEEKSNSAMELLRKGAESSGGELEEGRKIAGVLQEELGSIRSKQEDFMRQAEWADAEECIADLRAELEQTKQALEMERKESRERVASIQKSMNAAKDIAKQRVVLNLRKQLKEMQRENDELSSKYEHEVSSFAGRESALKSELDLAMTESVSLEYKLQEQIDKQELMMRSGLDQSEAEKRVKVMHGQLKQAWGELNQAYQALEREREQSNLRVQDQKATLESESALKGNLESSMSNLKAFEELQESIGEITSGSSEETIEQGEQSQADAEEQPQKKSWWGFSARK